MGHILQQAGQVDLSEVIEVLLTALHRFNLVCRHLYMRLRKLHKMQLSLDYIQKSLNYHCALSTLFGRSAGLYLHIICECASLTVCTYVVCVYVNAFV